MKIDLKHVTARKNKDGSTRYYFRRRGQPLVSLPGEVLSDEFMSAYNEQLNWQAPAVQDEYGTFAWVCDRYMASNAFTSKANATRNARKRILASILSERTNPKFTATFAKERATSITPLAIEILRDRKSDAPNAANERLKVLNQVFKFAKKQKLVKSNPVIEVERLEVATDGHATATNEHIAQYREFHKDGPARLAIDLLCTFGMRVSDLRLIGKRNVKDGVLSFVTEKSGVECDLTIPEKMTFPNQMYFLHTEHGKPFASEKAMSARVSKWFKQAGVDGITAHSVRKWLAVQMAEDGSTENELMSWFGWRDAKEAKPYTQRASRKKMAANAARKRRNV